MHPSLPTSKASAVEAALAEGSAVEAKPLDAVDPHLDRACRGLSLHLRLSPFTITTATPSTSAPLSWIAGPERPVAIWRGRFPLCGNSLEVMSVSKLEERLQAHLARVTVTSPRAGLESRVLPRANTRRSALPTPSWLAQALTVGALIALGIVVLIGLRTAREGAVVVKPKATATPPAATSPIPATSFYVIQMFNSNAGWLLTDQGLL